VFAILPVLAAADLTLDAEVLRGIDVVSKDIVSQWDEGRPRPEVGNEQDGFGDEPKPTAAPR
jgi:hypothetical protein